MSATSASDQSDWITLSKAAKILKIESDRSEEASRWRLFNLLRLRPDIARLVRVSSPSRSKNKIRPTSLVRLPDHCLWTSKFKVNWTHSKVPAFPLLSGTQWENLYTSNQMLPLRIQRTEVLAAAQEERSAREGSLASKRDTLAALFAAAFWPVPRVLSWITYRKESSIDKSWRPAIFRSTSTNADPPGRALVRALQGGGLKALRDGKVLPRELWSNATGWNWPDDVWFRRKDVLRVWPSLLVSQGQEEPAVLKPAPRQEIIAAIKDAYDAANAKGSKPPNIRELPADVLPLLEQKGYQTSKRAIAEIGARPEFKCRRRKPGATISSEQRKQEK